MCPVCDANYLHPLTPFFTLQHAAKDVRLALALADQAGMTMPVMQASNGQYASVLEALGDEDFSAVMKVNLKK